ncbi:MAG: imidazole glycerol phosphate synthase subunit HisH [Anaerolineae bacterium]|nr:imidazole glycerol phosphate synthase subunit HisH [Anaerolineae bacterium]
MIAIVDYGVGNLRSVEKALQQVGAQTVVTSDGQTILDAGGVVVPGVGAFRDGMAQLRRQGLDRVICMVAAQGKPLLGICLGMQLLFESSEEMGFCEGLALLEGRVVRFPATGLKIPQTGWNRLWFAQQHPLLGGLSDGCYVYFNHSYFCQATAQEVVLAHAEYGIRYPVAVGCERVFGVQFHPEKSQEIGLRILRNFVEMAR